MNNAAVWRLSSFCQFYGRVIPVDQKSDGKFSKFHTYTRNPDIDDLYVKFNEELEPMNFQQIVIRSSSLYVIGHGEAYEDFNGRMFFDKYTLFSEEQIRKLSGSSINYLAGGTLEHLLEWGQAVIINKADYIKNLDEDIKDENEDMFGLSDIDWSELRKG